MRKKKKEQLTYLQLYHYKNYVISVGIPSEFVKELNKTFGSEWRTDFVDEVRDAVKLTKEKNKYGINY